MLMKIGIVADRGGRRLETQERLWALRVQTHPRPELSIVSNVRTMFAASIDDYVHEQPKCAS